MPPRPLLLAALLGAAVLAVYAQTLGFGFVAFDDGYYVTQNPRVRAGLDWDGVAWAFTTDTLVNWHPLTWLSYMLDHELHGLDPAGYHATNVALHLLNALLLFGALRALTRADLESALVAALFALHPLRVESVAWISERKDVLCASFGLVALWAWTAWTRRGGAGRYALAAVALALGLLAKPMLVTLPGVLVLLDVWPLRRFRSLRSSLAEKLPLLALCGASAAVTFALQRSGGAMDAAVSLPPAARLANAALACAAYLADSVWPTGLGPHYPHPWLLGEPPAAWRVAGAAALVAGVSALAWRARREPALLPLAVGWLWFLGMLLPVIGLVQVGAQARADRYTYLPQIGLLIALVWSGAELARRRPRAAPALRALALLAPALLAVASFAQARHWRDSLALFERAVAVAPGDPAMTVNLGFALQQEGRLEEAERAYRRAVALAPEFAEAHFNLAGVRVQRGDLDDAVRHYRRALALAPGHALVHRNLAGALRARGDLEQSIAHYREALRLRPDDARAHTALAGALHAAGAPEDAVAHYRRALALDPGLADAHAGLGSALGAGGDLEGAVAHLERALELQPDHAAARARLRYARAHGGAGAPAAPATGAEAR